MTKNTTSIRLDNHEKLCRIMQKQTHDKINDLAKQINRLEKILIGAAGLNDFVTRCWLDSIDWLMLQKNKGCLCENIAVCWLQENGYFVFKGCQTQSAIDLIAVHPTYFRVSIL